ncbi:MAG: hypothetical protein AAB443_01500 [Patescibacteria group bacterium]
MVKSITKVVFAIPIILVLTFTSGKSASAAVEKWGPNLKDSPSMIAPARQAYLGLGGDTNNWVPFEIMMSAAGIPGDVAGTKQAMQEMLDIARTNKMMPVVRLTTRLCSGGVSGWEKLTLDYARYTAQAFNSVDASGFPDTIRLEWGNEVNLGREWGNEMPDPGEYSSTYTSFKAQLTNPNISTMPSSINTSNPDVLPPQAPAMDAIKFYQGLSGTTGSGLASHPYETDVPGPARYRITAWDFDNDYAKTTSPIIVNGGGLSPNFVYGGSRVNFNQRIDYLKASFQGSSYLGVPPLTGGPDAKYLMPDLQDDPTAGGGTDQFLVMVYGPGGTTTLPLAGGGSRGGGTCEDIEDTNTEVLPACTPEDLEIEPEEFTPATLRGTVTNSYTNNFGKRIIPSMATPPLTGAKIAWVETFARPAPPLKNQSIWDDLNKPDENEEKKKNATYNSTTIQNVNGKYQYELQIPKDKTSYLMVICGNKVLDVFSVNPNGNSNVKLDLSYAKFIEGCGGSNECLRLKPVGDVTKAGYCPFISGTAPVADEMVPDKIVQISQQLGKFSLSCVKNLLSCVKVVWDTTWTTLGGFAGSQKQDQVKGIARDHASDKQAIRQSWGEIPYVDKVSCEAIKANNERMSLIRNMPIGANLLGMRPGLLTEICIKARERQGALIACQGTPLSGICAPGEVGCTMKDSKYFPLYMCAYGLDAPGVIYNVADSPFGAINSPEGVREPIVVNNNTGSVNLESDYTPHICGGPYLDEADIGCYVGDPITENRDDCQGAACDTQPTVYVSGPNGGNAGPGPATSVATVASMYTRPGVIGANEAGKMMNIEDADPTPTAALDRTIFSDNPVRTSAYSAVIRRLKILGNECPCDGEQLKVNKKYDDGFVCTKGGLRFNMIIDFGELIDAFLANLLKAFNDCALLPTPEEVQACQDAETEYEASADLTPTFKVPYAAHKGAPAATIADVVKMPYHKPVQKIGTLGTVNTELERNRIPWTAASGVSGEALRTGEFVRNMFCIPREGVSCGVGGPGIEETP